MTTLHKSSLTIILITAAILALSNRHQEVATAYEDKVDSTVVATQQVQTQQALPEIKKEVLTPSPELITREQVQEKAEEFFTKTPTVASLRHLTERDVHLTPAIVLEAGQDLAEMREFFVNNPHKTEDELVFYMNCANNVDLLDSVRSVCAARASSSFKKITGKDISPLVFDSRIAQLKDLVDI